MAIGGMGRDIDLNMKAGDSVKTTTSQYLVVGIEDTSTSADSTVYLAGAGSTPASTITSRNALGIQQRFLSSTSDVCTVRVMGRSKAKCAASISVGAFVSAYEGASTTTFAGHIVAQAIGTVLTATSAKVVLGRALESGSTNSVISVALLPTLLPIA